MDFRGVLRHLLGHGGECSRKVEDVQLAALGVQTRSTSPRALSRSTEHPTDPLFALVFFLLRKTSTSSPGNWKFLQTLQEIVTGVVPAFAVFGFYRLWLAIVEFWPACFYQSEAHQDPALIGGNEPTTDFLKVEKRWARGNLWFALAYLAIATLVPWCLASGWLSCIGLAAS